MDAIAQARAALTAQIEAAELIGQVRGAFVVCQADQGYNPVVERDGGYALMCGPVAVFPAERRANTIAIRMTSNKFHLTAMPASEWAAKYSATLRGTLSRIAS